jgi:L-threonylcarbamoyladenylate synthase
VADPMAIDEAVRVLREGGLVVVPTDTVYGIAGRPDIDGVTARIFEVKRRPRRLTLPVLVADRGQAAHVAVVDERAQALADRFWPGGLTLVLRRAEAGAGWDLGAEQGTIGVRIPDHPVTRELLGRTGPLAVTSANRSGEPTPPDCEGIRAVFGDQLEHYVCADPLPGFVPSTIIDLSGDAPRILREGALPSADALEVILG